MMRYITKFLCSSMFLIGGCLTMWLSIAYAQQPVPLEATSKAITSTVKAAPVELIERRTANSKHYKLGTFLYEAKISVRPIHYLAEDGRWLDIDLRPMPQVDGTFVVTASDVKINFPAKLDAALTLTARAYLAPASTVIITNTMPVLPLFDGKPDLRQMATRARSLLAASETVITFPFTLSWQLQPLQWINDQQMGATITHEAVAVATDEQVSYDEGAMSQKFYPLVDGWRQVLVLTSKPNQMTATHLVQNMTLNLPPDIHHDGAVFYDLVGRAVFTLTSPQLLDAKGNMVVLSYQIEPITDGVALKVALPFTWLNKASYPVQMKNRLMVASSSLLPTSRVIPQTGQIWECQPDIPLSEAAMIHIGNRSDGACAAGIERALVQWSVSSLPITAVIAFPPNSPGINSSVTGQVQGQLWHFPADDLGGGTISVATHLMLTPWDVAATWQNRTVINSWTLPGGKSNQDYLGQAEDTVNVLAQGLPQYVNVGSLYNVVGSWHTTRIFDDICRGSQNCYGDINYGVMYRAANETPGLELDRVFASGDNFKTAPMLVVDYLEVALSPAIGSRVLTVPRAPSPDYFRVDFARNSANSRIWTALAIQPTENEVRSDYDLILSNVNGSILDSLNSPSVKISQQRGTKTDFIAISPGIVRNLYAWALQFEGSSPYYLKYIVNTSRLNLGDSKDITVSKTSVMEMYELNLTAGVKYNLALNYVSGTADVSMVLFPPGEGQAFAIQNALDEIDAGTFGEGEQMTFVAAQTGIYGLAVLNNGQGSSSTSSFNLKLQKYVAQNYLPILLKQLPPSPPPVIVPDNGDFESNLDKWTAMNPGSPLVAKAVANNDGSCFSGKTVALLGTPTSPTDLINNIPVNREVILSQSFTVPANATALTFQYKVTSYDIVQNNKGIYDYFSVRINGLEQNPPGKVGNPAQSLPLQKVLIPWNSDCQTASINVTQYAGKSITLEFAVRNGVWNDRNTWAYLDEVKVETN